MLDGATFLCLLVFSKSNLKKMIRHKTESHWIYVLFPLVAHLKALKYCDTVSIISKSQEIVEDITYVKAELLSSFLQQIETSQWLHVLATLLGHENCQSCNFPQQGRPVYTGKQPQNMLGHGFERQYLFWSLIWFIKAHKVVPATKPSEYRLLNIFLNMT